MQSTVVGLDTLRVLVYCTQLLRVDMSTNFTSTMNEIRETMNENSKRPLMYNINCYVFQFFSQGLAWRRNLLTRKLVLLLASFFLPIYCVSLSFFFFFITHDTWDYCGISLLCHLLYIPVTRKLLPAPVWELYSMEDTTWYPETSNPIKMGVILHVLLLF